MIMYTIWPTRNCNLNCTYCYENNKRASRMDIETVDSVVKFIREGSDSFDDINVRFHGGEPLLEFEVIRKIVERLKVDKRAKRYFITTNAMLLNKEIIDFLIENSFIVSISIDGNRFTHDRYRKDKQGRGTFDTVMERIRLLQTNNLAFTARGTFNSDSVCSLHENVKYLYKIGVRNIAIMPDSFDRGWDLESLNTLKIELEKNIEFQKSLKENGERVEIALTHKDECKSLGVCGGGDTSFSILPNGDIFPCLYAIDFEDCLIGNVKTGLIKDRIDQLLSTYKEPISECEGCNFEKYCSVTRCRYVNRLQTGYYSRPDMIRCNLESLIGMKLYHNGV